MENRCDSYLQGLVSKKKFIVLFGIIAFFYVTFMSYICFKTKIYFRSNDALYYLSIAENYLENGVFMDGTQTPNSPVITPQNGVVGLFVLLKMLSFSKHQSLIFMLILNYGLLLSSIFPLIKISRAVGLTKNYLVLLMICIYLGHIKVYQWLFMAPVNDMIFYSGQLWLLYLLICIDKYFSNEMSPRKGMFICQMITCCLISLAIVHFRINSIFVPLGGMAAALLTRKYKMFFLSGFLLVTMVLSLSSIFLFFDSFDFSNNTSGVTAFLKDIPNQMYIFLFRLLPESLFRDLNAQGNLLYIPFYISMLLAFIHGIKERNLHLLLILFISVLTFMMTILHGCITERYLWVVSAFMFMMLVRIQLLRTIGYLFIGAVLLNTLWALQYSMDVSRDVLTWENIAAKNVLKADRDLVIAQEYRSCWYFTGISPVQEGKYTWDALANADSVYLIGKDDYVEFHQNELQKLAKEHLHRIDLVRIPSDSPENLSFAIYKVILLSSEEASADG